MESRRVIAEALIQWNKWFSARNQYVDDCHVKWMNTFGRNMDEEEDGISEDEESEEDSEEKEESEQEE